ncbi:hypothetical protein P6F26_09610 [Roseibacterium sp. SDUM158017]|uniref:hypothetical protein n=1 Tax=Roseicyclus salinarum TaxID=3036773 RepID=UPI0024153941|nr:hypothetical protein [Roseibacterium sp. SDUM158017]MDG4648704.1 hypothetical protein [Roseibacterium sp. SDUM158017]
MAGKIGKLNPVIGVVRKIPVGTDAGLDPDAGLDVLFDIAATAQVVREIASAIRRHERFG